ncbi:MAG: YbaY family lipoprotein [Marinibacterium sp.]|nr:YbaY family lipoprotein [Marinibacterium sp.]
MWKQICAIALAVMTMSTEAALAETRQVTGSVTYRERIALPPGAVLKVSLLDVSQQDVAATVISSDSMICRAYRQSLACPITATSFQMP